MRDKNGMSRIISFVSSALAVASGLMILILMMMVFVNALLRALGLTPMTGVVEMVGAGMVIAAFPALGYAQQAGAHINMEFFDERATEGQQKVLRLAALVISLAVVVWVAYATGSRFLLSVGLGEISYGDIPFPIWPFRLIILTGLVWWCVEIVHTYVRPPKTPNRASNIS